MEWFTTENGEYRVESLSAATFPGALWVIREAFCKDESVCIGSEVNTNSDAAEELLELCADAALDGVSLVAVEARTGEVAAALFNKIQVPVTGSSEKSFFEVFSEERCKQESSRSLIQFMVDVDGRCNLFEKYKADCSLELMFIATLNEHRKKNLATFLCEQTLRLAKQLKKGPVSKITVQDLGPNYSHMAQRLVPTTAPKICQAIWTGKGTIKIGKKLNFTVAVTVPYTEFVFNGKTYADRLGDQNSYCEVVAKKIE